MAKSIYGFAQSAASGSGVTEALRLYQRAVAQGADKNGMVSNPDVYRLAREKFLSPFADDVRASTKMAESTNDENRLRDKQNDVTLAASTFRQQVNDVLGQYAKTYYKSPENLIQTTSYVYNTAVDSLDKEIQDRKVAGQAVGDLQNLMNEFSRKADILTRLSRQTLAGGAPQNPNAYGWFIKTNPEDGTIVSLALDGVDSADKASGGYTRTNMSYGKVPVWTNSVVDDSGQVTARIGSNKFKLEKNTDTNYPILKATDKQWGRYVKSLVPGGETPAQATEASKTLNLGAIQFGDVLSLPKNSVAKDAGGNYYFYGNDGVYKAQSKDVLQKYLNFTGVKMQGDLDASAYPISSSEAKAFGSFTNSDGSSRIIDEKTLGGLHGGVNSGSQNLLPPVNQSVQGSFKAAPAPMNLQPVPDFPTTASTTKLVPRKDPAVKKTSQVGSPNVADTIDTQGKKFSGSFNELA